MAKNTVVTITSDLSNELIPEGEAWTMTLTPPDGRRTGFELDLSEEEALELGRKGRELAKRRGRPKGSRNRPKDDSST